MRLQTLDNDKVIAYARTDSDFLRLQTAIPVVKEYELPGPGLEDCRRRHHELASQARLQSDIDEHARLQLESWVRNRQPHTNGARCHIYLRQYLFNLSGECAPWIGIGVNLRRIAGLYPANVVLENLRIHPHARQIGDGIELGRWLYIHIRQGISLSDISLNRRVDGEVADGFAGFLQLSNLTWRHLPLLQPLFCCSR